MNDRAREELRWISGVVRLPLLDAEDTTVGRIDDVVVATGYAGAPRVSGFVALVDRRRIFVHVNRVRSVEPDGVRLRSGTVDLRRFQGRSGELLAEEDLVATRTPKGVIADVALRPTSHDGRPGYEVAVVAVRRRAGLLRRDMQVLPWHEVPALVANTAAARHLARLSQLHKADAAERLLALPDARRAELLEAMDVGRLADLLEELPEADQVELLEALDVERIADVVDEMEPDDAVDLLRELPPEEREQVLGELPEDEAEELRGLLDYDDSSAGGLMTSEPVVVGPETSVAEVLARLRSLEGPPALAARVFVTETPHDVPTGPYLGCVGIQRLLREPPPQPVGEILDPHVPTIRVEVPQTEVARTLARYDLLAIAVVDDDRRLVGVVTVDDVLARLLELAAEAAGR